MWGRIVVVEVINVCPAPLSNVIYCDKLNRKGGVLCESQWIIGIRMFSRCVVHAFCLLVLEPRKSCTSVLEKNSSYVTQEVELG